MKDIRAYLEISAEKELPNKWMKDEHGDEYEVVLCSSLKPFSLPELMEEYMCHIGENYQYVLLNGVPHYRKFGSTDHEYFKPKELFNEFLTQKGIL